MPLTERQKRFIKEYPVDLNGAQAAIRAGYSAHTAKAQASRLLSDDRIAAAVRDEVERRNQRTEITQDRVLREIARLAFANMLDYVTVQADGLAYVDLSALDRDKAAAISEVTVEEYTEGRGEAAREVKRVRFKLADKRPHLELLARHVGLRVGSRVEHTGKDGGPIEHRDLSDGDIKQEIDAIFGDVDGPDAGKGGPPLH